MKTTTKSALKEWGKILLVAFTVGAAIHFGINTAKLTWPSPPIELEVAVSE